MTGLSRRRLLGAVAASVALAGCGDPNATKGNRENEVPEGYTRLVDCEAGMVIYEQNSGEGGFEVVPIEDTDLYQRDFCDD